MEHQGGSMSDLFKVAVQAFVAQTQVVIELRQQKVSDLEADRDRKAPLVKIAVDLRLRFLEQARETALKITRQNINSAIIDDGNKAAHRGNGEVDAALFKAELVPEEYKEAPTAIYKEMYQVLPSEYPRWSPKVLRLVDCQASIKALKQPNASDVCGTKRAEKSRIEKQLIDLITTPPAVGFEACPEVDGLIVQLEALTNNIIQLDRSRNGRRRQPTRMAGISWDLPGEDCIPAATHTTEATWETSDRGWFAAATQATEATYAAPGGYWSTATTRATAPKWGDGT